MTVGSQRKSGNKLFSEIRICWQPLWSYCTATLRPPALLPLLVFSYYSAVEVIELSDLDHAAALLAKLVQSVTDQSDFIPKA